MLGIDAALSGWDEGHAYGVVDYSHRISTDFSAFARGFGGMSMMHGTELGVVAGIELEL